MENGCSYNDVTLEVAYAHLNSEKVEEDKRLRLYNDIWYLRWALISIVSLIYPNFPITLLIIWSIFDFVLLLYAILCLGGFRGISGILVIFEELFVFIWHFGLMCLFYNYGSKEELGKFWFNLFNYFITIGFFFSILIEIILAFLGFGGHKREPVVKVMTEDFEFSEFTEEKTEKIDKKFKTYIPDLEGKLKFAMKEVGRIAWTNDKRGFSVGK